MLRESLSPDTDAIPRASVEFQTLASHILVRYRNLEGAMMQRKFKDHEREKVMQLLSTCVSMLREEVKTALAKGANAPHPSRKTQVQTSPLL